MSDNDEPAQYEHSQSDTDILERDEIKKPRLFKVLLINDNYTTMNFVVQVLKTIFYKSAAEAEAIMLAVHKEGKGTAGVYTYETAETKVLRTIQLAREHQFPLKAALEPWE